jgi:hypothetical protein
MKMIKIEDAAWAAGFYEGEGNISFGQRGGVKVAIKQVNIQPLQKMKNIFGGTIYGPKYNGKNCQDVYTWALSTYKEVNNFVWSLSPWLSEKRLIQMVDKIEYKINMRDLRSEYCRNHHIRTYHSYLDFSGKLLCRKCRSISKKKQYRKKKEAENV